MKGKTVHRRGFGVAMGLAFAGVLALPALASAEPISETAVRIEIDTSALREDEQLETEQWVTDKQTAVLKEAGFVVSDDAEHVIRIEISRYGEYGVHAKGRLMLVGDEGSVREFICEMCGVSQFLTKVVEHTELVAERLRRNLTEEKEPAGGSDPAIELEHVPQVGAEAEVGPTKLVVDDEPVDHGGKRLGGVGYAGVASLVAGFGVTLGGIIVVVEDPSDDPRPDHDRDVEITDRVPLGAGLTVGGALLLATGAALLAVDQTVLRKRRSQGTRAVFAPAVSPTTVGFSWTARF